MPKQAQPKQAQPDQTQPKQAQHSEAATPALGRTALYDLHVAHDARLVDFAGWELPIQYEGVIAEHEWCRASASLFDVSHMGLVEFRSSTLSMAEIASALERVNPAGITTLKPNAMRYGFLLNSVGGIVDDLMLTNNGDHFAAVINGSRRDVDLAYLREHLSDRDHLSDLNVVERDDVALLALQGPLAVRALSRLAPEVSDLYFLQTTSVKVAGAPVEVSRSGYTGEDGFELVVPNESAMAVAQALLNEPEVKPAGLGARDTLRLEAGLCLYGNDLDETTSPIEADLRWAIPKRRRDAGDFPGGDRIKDEVANGPKRIRVGLAVEGKRPVRGHSVLTTTGGEPAGEVTSGGYGPTIQAPIAMGFIRPELAAVGTELLADVRGKQVPVTVAELPFTPHHYRRAPKA